jgi:hypothetical protein
LETSKKKMKLIFLDKNIWSKSLILMNLLTKIRILKKYLRALRPLKKTKSNSSKKKLKVESRKLLNKSKK